MVHDGAEMIWVLSWTKADDSQAVEGAAAAVAIAVIVMAVVIGVTLSTQDSTGYLVGS